MLRPSEQGEVCGEVGKQFESAHGCIIDMGFSPRTSVGVIGGPQ